MLTLKEVGTVLTNNCRHAKKTKTKEQNKETSSSPLQQMPAQEKLQINKIQANKKHIHITHMWHTWEECFIIITKDSNLPSPSHGISITQLNGGLYPVTLVYWWHLSLFNRFKLRGGKTINHRNLFLLLYQILSVCTCNIKTTPHTESPRVFCRLMSGKFELISTMLLIWKSILQWFSNSQVLYNKIAQNFIESITEYLYWSNLFWWKLFFLVAYH